MLEAFFVVLYSYNTHLHFKLSSPSDIGLLLAIVQLVYPGCTLRIMINSVSIIEKEKLNGFAYPINLFILL